MVTTDRLELHLLASIHLLHYAGMLTNAPIRVAVDYISTSALVLDLLFRTSIVQMAVHVQL